MRKRFGELDANHDGLLDFDELRDMLKKGNPTFTDSECRQLYDSCDKNHDGKIDIDEFFQYVCHGAAARRGPLTAAPANAGTDAPIILPTEPDGLRLHDDESRRAGIRANDDKMVDA